MGFEVFTAQVESGTGTTKIALSGELDLKTVPILEEYLGRVEAEDVAAIVIDLRELTFVESVGLHAFLAARDRADANGRQLLLVGAKNRCGGCSYSPAKSPSWTTRMPSACSTHEPPPVPVDFRAGRPMFMRKVNGWLTIFWLAMIPVSIVTHWINSVTYVAALSLWALVSGHWSAWQVARVEVNQEAEAKQRDDEDVAGEIVERMVKETNVAAEPGSHGHEGGDR